MQSAKYHEIQSPVKQAILRTLVYSDIFNFPLTEKELWFFLKSDSKITKTQFHQACKDIHTVSKIEKYYCLKGKEKSVIQRKQRARTSEAKYYTARKVSRVVSAIPTIMFIGVSGSVAAKNASEEADIDLFVIVKHNTLWISRLLFLSSLAWMGLRRRKNTPSMRNKICVNMLVDEYSLLLPIDRQDVYTAHEIAQMKPLFDRQKTYTKFLKTNSWIRFLMPNALEEIFSLCQHAAWSQSRNSELLQRIIGNSLFELLAKKLQLARIHRTLTTETISHGLLAFHPVDARKKVLKIYTKHRFSL